MSGLLAFLGFGTLAMLFRLPRKWVFAGGALYWSAGLLSHVLLPDHHPVAAWFGGSWRSWAAIGVLAALGGAYALGVRYLRRRSAPGAGRAPAAFTETELDRYARHIVLREVGGTGQKQLKAAKVLVVGAGGLGAPVLMYLAAAGVGTIGVIDDDHVSNSNLQRQIIHTDARIGQPKVASAEIAMKALNPFISIKTYHRRLTADAAPTLFAAYDLILDGSDNFETRYLVNAAAIAAGKPLISAAISQWEGQIGVYDPARGGPCYACVFPERPVDGLAPSCAEAGVIAPLPGIIGSMMALEAVKYLTGAGEVLRGQLVIFDGLWGESRKMKVARNSECRHCGRQENPTQEQA